MDTKLTIEQQISFFEDKANYMDETAKDAANLKYWSLAKFARNESAIARGEIRGLKAAVASMKACESDQNV